LGAIGVNVTIPHKQAVVTLADDLSDAAQLAGAVNTLHFTDQGIRGHNTDVGGWWNSVKPYVHGDLNVALLGAGGAARAILAALSLFAPDARVRLIGRDPDRVRTLATAFRDRLDIRETLWDERHAAIAQTRLVVNTTPVGMWPHVDASVVSEPACFSSEQVVQDIVYRPRQTKFLAQASARGALVVDGLSMLIYQGAEALTFWTGQSAPVADMMRAAEAFLRAAEA
ncbi:MAG: shikimate dehydrogenase, partial [Alicyclobacillus sp.]|nr:shikimate dehydrogenase [Alicyclobacillus sp.]